MSQVRFVALRGDDYLRDVDDEDVPHLYPYRSLLSAGVPVAPSSDAPYGELSPAATMAAAANRRTASRVTLGGDQAVPPSVVLAGYLSARQSPGGPQRRVRVGAPADLCVLAGTVAEVAPDTWPVRCTIADGRITHYSEATVPI